MSKTLFNTNTFQSKTLQNSNTIDIGDSNVTNFTATNATITNLTNTELQAATSGVATNASAIANKQDEITSSNRLSATLIGANGNVSNTEFGYLSSVTSDIQTQFNNINTTVATNTTKTTAISYDDTGATPKTTFADDVHISGALSTVNFTNINDSLFANNLATALNTAKVGITTAQASAIVANTSGVSSNASNITSIGKNITAIEGDISTINTNINGLSYDGTDTTTLENKLTISKDTQPQLLIQRESGAGDTVMRIRGKRNGSTGNRQAKLDFQNNDSGSSPTTKTMVSIVGRVTNHTDNVGGLELVSYTDGTTGLGALTMDKDGNFNIGGGTVFQDDYKVQINGTLNVSSSIYQIPQMTTYNFDKAIVSNDLWGNGNKQTDLVSTRTAGTAFSTHSSGTITFTQTGTYKIKASGNLQSIGANDRLAFAIYLALINSEVSTTDYFQDQNYNFFSWLYTRNITDGAHGNVAFEDLVYITSGKSIEIRNKLDIDNTSYDDTISEDKLNLYLNVEITKISSVDIYNP